MIDLLATARSKGEAALRRGAWAFAGAGLLVLALGFAAAAGVAALELVAPDYVALAAGAVALLICAGICLARAKPPHAPPAETAGSLALEAGAAAEPGDWRALLNAALAREAREKPARAAAIAAIAGLILGAIEALDEGRTGH